MTTEEKNEINHPQLPRVLTEEDLKKLIEAVSRLTITLVLKFPA